MLILNCMRWAVTKFMEFETQRHCTLVNVKLQKCMFIFEIQQSIWISGQQITVAIFINKLKATLVFSSLVETSPSSSHPQDLSWLKMKFIVFPGQGFPLHNHGNTVACLTCFSSKYN